MNGMESPLRPRHRRISSSSQSLRELIDNENIIENITPSHCDLYLITRKKLSQINTNTIKQSHDLRREVLLTSIHRTITSKASLNNNTSIDITSGPIIKDKLSLNGFQHQSTNNSDQHLKNGSLSLTTSTCTTTMANTVSGTTNSTQSMPSSLKKRNLTSPQSPPNSDYEEEWKTTIKRLKVVHGIDFSYDVAMDSEFDDFCDSDLNDLTNNFHRLKTPFT